MKTKQHHAYFNRDNNNSCEFFFALCNSVFSIKGNFSFAVFQFLKTENEKLQIKYANIRV